MSVSPHQIVAVCSLCDQLLDLRAADALQLSIVRIAEGAGPAEPTHRFVGLRAHAGCLIARLPAAPAASLREAFLGDRPT